MPRKIKVDYKKLLKMVNDGVPQKEIMAELGLKTSPQFKTAYLNALIETGQVTKPAGSRVKQAKPVSREVTVNSRGSLTIPKALVADLGIKVGEKFTIRKSRAGLSLKRI